HPGHAPGQPGQRGRAAGAEVLVERHRPVGHPVPSPSQNRGMCRAVISGDANRSLSGSQSRLENHATVSYTPGGPPLYPGLGADTFLKVRSPRAARTGCARIRAAVSGPMTISPPAAEAAMRAATLVVGPVAVKVQRCPPAPPSLVAPTRA